MQTIHFTLSWRCAITPYMHNVSKLQRKAVLQACHLNIDALWHHVAFRLFDIISGTECLERPVLPERNPKLSIIIGFSTAVAAAA